VRLTPSAREKKQEVRFGGLVVDVTGSRRGCSQRSNGGAGDFMHNRIIVRDDVFRLPCVWDWFRDFSINM
jgi:hypothetical protein